MKASHTVINRPWRFGSVKEKLRMLFRLHIKREKFEKDPNRTNSHDLHFFGIRMQVIPTYGIAFRRMSRILRGTIRA